MSADAEIANSRQLLGRRMIQSVGLMSTGLLQIPLLPVYLFMSLATDRMGEPFFEGQSAYFLVLGFASFMTWVLAVASVTEARGQRLFRIGTLASAAIWLLLSLPWIATCLLNADNGASLGGWAMVSWIPVTVLFAAVCAWIAPE